MYVTTNSALVWKREANQNQQAARLMARISVTLAILLLGMSAYAYSTSARYDDMCTTIEIKSGRATSDMARDFGRDIAASYCG